MYATGVGINKGNKTRFDARAQRNNAGAGTSDICSRLWREKTRERKGDQAEIETLLGREAKRVTAQAFAVAWTCCHQSADSGVVAWYRSAGSSRIVARSGGVRPAIAVPVLSQERNSPNKSQTRAKQEPGPEIATHH